MHDYNGQLLAKICTKMKMANQFKESLAIQLIKVFVPDNSVADHFDVWSDKCQRSFKKL